MRILVALLATTSLAHAADLPERQIPTPLPPAPVAIAPNWTGFYIGGHGGWATGNFKGDLGYNDPTLPGFSAADIFDPVNQKVTATGFIAGGQIGFNWQPVGSPLVFGIEADASWTNFKGSFVAHGLGAAPDWHISIKLDWFGTVRGRLGYAVNDAIMLYGTGGLAYGRTSGNIRVVYVAPEDGPGGGEIARGDATANHFGWTAGAGLEFMMGRYWSFKAEYLYVDLGEKDHNFVGTQDNTPIVYQTDSFSPALKFHAFRGGLNFRF